VVLGKAKVISYKDLEEVRAKRAAKEKISLGKGKRGYKRKSAKLELGMLELETKVTRISEIPEPWRALVA